VENIYDMDQLQTEKNVERLERLRVQDAYERLEKQIQRLNRQIALTEERNKEKEVR
jgi:hypothetical protein